MSWDILPKANLQYFLSKLKDKLDLKVDKENGKVLSDNNYTTTEKNKLAGIASGAEQNVQTDWNQSDNTADDYLKNKPSVPEDLNDLDDVNISSPSNNDVLKYNSTSQKWENGTGGSGNGYSPDDTAETTLADDDKIPFYDTSASGRRNSTWANIKAKLKAYFDTLYGTVTGVKGNSESSYRTGNVNLTPDNIGAVNKTGDTMTGSLKIGNPADTSTFPSYGITVHDTRDADHAPSVLQRAVNFFFSHTGTPNSDWCAGMMVRGWTGTGYNSWELVGPASVNNQSTTPLYVRTSNSGSSWGSWRKIYDSGNKPSKSDVGLGNVDNTADANKSVNYATSAGSATSATKATQDSDGNAINTTYMKKGVDYVTAGQRSGTSSASNATMEGSETWAAQYAHAEGYKTSANGHGSHAEGGYSTSTSYIGTLALGASSHAEGVGTTANGMYSHAEGYATSAYGTGSHAEGIRTLSNGEYSHSEGYWTTAGGKYSHAEGGLSNASGYYSHVEGGGYTYTSSGRTYYKYSVASGNYSHSEGQSTTASGPYSHAEGCCTSTDHNTGHAEGYYTKTGADYQHVCGKYNEGKSDTIFEIGYGTSITRKNVFEVYNNGNIRAPYSDIISLQSGKCYLHKVGRSVTCYFCGLDSYTFRAGASAVLIPDAYAEYRPYSSVCGFSFIFKANNDMYLCTLDLSSTGILGVNYISNIASNGKMNRAAPANTGHLVWGTMCWITAS